MIFESRQCHILITMRTKGSVSARESHSSLEGTLSLLRSDVQARESVLVDYLLSRYSTRTRTPVYSLVNLDNLQFKGLALAS